ncbi:AAA domain-containing protein [Delphinella strobiligena]|nr:AAA domain-containing protein [Delphinella strobiligena]
MRLNILRKLPAKVLLVEEAGEVLESHLIMALLPSIEHAILIGDHLQLRPHCQNHLSMESKEGQQYAMDQSLFERLVQPVGESFVKLPFSRLEIQRRMHPAIARLVRDTLYPTLVDTSPEYPEVLGMKNRLFWFNHQNAEDDNNETTSFTNDWEVEMVTALAHHLVKQGTYEAGEIAVLTPYLAQLERLKDRMGEVLEIVLGERDVDELESKGRIEPAGPASDPATGPVPIVATLDNAVRIATVDNFQGEEAKIIIVSLVRSNHRRKCGFLKTSNRINVLLSRAKHGMYIVGDRSAPENVNMWGKVLDILEETKCIGPTLEIQCQQHPERVSQIYGPEDFMLLAPDGGCGELCARQLNCGHACPEYCHSELLHDTVKCIEPCARLLKNCQHACPKLCHEACLEECKVKLDVNIALPCDHVLESVPCHLYQNQDQIVCEELVEPMVPACGHIVEVSCSVDVTSPDFCCDEQCGVMLPCGHHCQSACHRCRPKVDGKILEVEHKPCQELCRKQYLDCTHRCERECHGGISCGPCPHPCKTQCAHSKCNRKCAEPCLPCSSCMEGDYDDEGYTITATTGDLQIQIVEKQYLCDNGHFFTTDEDNVFVRKGKCPQCSASIVEHVSAPPAVVKEEDQCNPQ